MKVYSFKPVSTEPSDLVKIQTLLNAAFTRTAKESYSYDFLEWEYNRNPAGKIVGYNAFKGETLAAHYVGLPMDAVVNGKREKGLLSLNTATHPDHRGKGLFNLLAEKTYRYAYEKGYSFVVGVANANSTHGFVKKLGFDLVGPLYTMIGRFGIQIPELNTDMQFYRIWDTDQIKWRFFQSPQTYVISRNHSGFSLHSKSSVPFLNIYMGRFESSLLPENFNLRQAVMPALMYIGMANSNILRRSFGFDLPVRLKPSPLNLIFKDLTNHRFTLDPDRVFFQAADFDAF